MRRLRIEHQTNQTAVVDVETGEAISGVANVEISMDSTGAYAFIALVDFELDILIDTEIEYVEPEYPYPHRRETAPNTGLSVVADFVLLFGMAVFYMSFLQWLFSK